MADIKFVGNAPVPSRKLKGVIETKKWWMFSWLTGSGRFKDDPFEDDMEKMRGYFREQGVLCVEIPQDKVLFNYPAPNKLVLVININEGRQYRLGEISFSGNNLF